MGIHIVPTFSDPFYTSSVTLDGKEYLFDFRYNSRTETWGVSIASQDGTKLISGLQCIVGRRLLAPYRYIDELPPGEILVTSGGPDTWPPGLEELGPGLRCELIYYDEGELPP